MVRQNLKGKEGKARDAGFHDGSVTDWWWSFQPHIADEPNVKDGLRKRRNELETVIEPHVTTRITRDAIVFRGKVQYVEEKLRESNRESRLAWAAIFALQCLYHLESAISNNSTYEMIRWAYAFGRGDFDFMVVQRCGREAWGAVALWELGEIISQSHRRNRAATSIKRRGQSKFQQHDEKIKFLYTKHHGKHNWMKCMLAELAADNIFISADTLRTRLKALNIYRK